MIEMPEKRRVLSGSYEHSQVAPLHDSPQVDLEPGPEVPPKSDPEITPEPSIHAEFESDGGHDFDKYPSPGTQSPSVWKRRRFGRSIRFWSLIAVGVLLALIAGSVLGIILHRNHER